MNLVLTICHIIRLYKCEHCALKYSNRIALVWFLHLFFLGGRWFSKILLNICGWYVKILTIPYRGGWVVCKRPKTLLLNIKLAPYWKNQEINLLKRCFYDQTFMWYLWSKKKLTNTTDMPFISQGNIHPHAFRRSPSTNSKSWTMLKDWRVILKGFDQFPVLKLSNMSGTRRQTLWAINKEARNRAVFLMESGRFRIFGATFFRLDCIFSLIRVVDSIALLILMEFFINSDSISSN